MSSFKPEHHKVEKNRSMKLTVAQQTPGCQVTLWSWRSAWDRLSLSLQSRASPPGLCCAAPPWLPAAPGPPSLTSGQPDRLRDAQTEAETHQSPVYHTAQSPGRHSLLTPIFLRSSLCPSARLQDWSQLLIRWWSGWSSSTTAHTGAGSW